MADSIVRLTVEDSSFNAKIKAAAKAFSDFGARVTSAGVDAFKSFATGANTWQSRQARHSLRWWATGFLVQMMLKMHNAN